jgi:hypothetical protein
MKKEYNKLYLFGPVCFQVLLNRGYSLINLLPQINLAIYNRDMIIAVGFEWLFGTVNIGYSKKLFVQLEVERRKVIQDQANKLGITYQQQKLRWGW